MLHVDPGMFSVDGTMVAASLPRIAGKLPDSDLVPHHAPPDLD